MAPPPQPQAHAYPMGNAIPQSMFGGQAVPGIQFGQGLNPYSVLDSRLIGRPEAFSGKEEDWPMWSLSVRSFAGSVHPEMLRLMQIAETRKDQEIDECEVGQSQKVLDNQLYFTLTQLCCKNKKVYDIISNIGVGRSMKHDVPTYAPELGRHH